MLDFDKAVKKQPDVVTSNGYAAVGSIAFLIVYAVLLVVITSALWISYLT